MSGTLENHLLKGVSRSFYLSLRLLPHPMRGAASLGYLLARTSDTLADASAAPIDARLAGLDAFHDALSGSIHMPIWDPALATGVADPRELALLEKTEALLAWLQSLPEQEASLVREVVGIIISGQKLDLMRFGRACGEQPAALSNDEELEDYTWRVAGCVGAFWTKLGFLTLGERFSIQPQERLIDRAITYGKGLQLVNILRDMATDLKAGRCYLPLPDPHDREALIKKRASWLERAKVYVDEGFEYAEALESRRLRASSVLPAMLGAETLNLMRDAGQESLHKRIKVPRRKVYLVLLRAFTM